MNDTKTEAKDTQAAAGNRGVDLRSVANLMAEVGLLEEKVAGTKDEDFFGSIPLVQMGIFRLVVMGEIKKGKSSFINALCGLPDLVPTHSDVATSTVFKIRYGKELRYTVFFKPKEGEEVGAKLEISKEGSKGNVMDYGTEDGNPKNIKGVDFISVEAPSPILSDGLIIVDTPGVGGLFAEHREIAYRHAPRADAIFFVCDSAESPIGAEEVKFLREDLWPSTKLLYFVQTKADLADVEAREKRKENNIAKLTDEVGIPRDQIHYFVLSNKLKEKADAARSEKLLKLSGYPPVLQFLQRDLKLRKDRNIATVALQRTGLKLDGVAASVEERRRILEADSEDKRARITEELNAAEEALRDWSQGDGKALSREFQTSLATLVNRERDQLLQATQPGGEISEEIGARLRSMSDPAQIYASAQGLANEAAARASSMLVAASRRIEQEGDALVKAMASKAGAQLAGSLTFIEEAEPQEALSEIRTNSLDALVARAQDAPVWDRVQASLKGGGVGLTLTVVGATVGSAVPIVGTLIGGTLGSAVGMVIGAAFGGTASYKRQVKQEADAGKREVSHAIDRMLGNIRVEITRNFDETATKLKHVAEDAILDIMRSCQERLKKQRDELRSRSQADAAELKKQTAEMESQAAGVATATKRLEALRSPLELDS